MPWVTRYMTLDGHHLPQKVARSAVIAGGMYLLLRAFSHQFRDQWRDRHTQPAVRRGMVAVARFGEGSRGFVFVMIGIFLVRAAWLFDPDEAKGLGESLRLLGAQPFGRWLLATVGAGFVAYALYSFIDAAFRKFGAGGSATVAPKVESASAASV